MSGCSSGCWREVFGIERVALVYGFSMGAQQAFHWGALFPDRVERIAPICGSAKTSAHNFVFLEGVKAPLTADRAWQDGWFATPPTRGFQAMGRVYAGWGLSQAFYREEIWCKIGFSSLEDFLIGSWEANSAAATLTTCWRCCGLGSALTSAPTSFTVATSIKHWARSPPTRS
jgi:homoserine acetyltransferase